jgi:hypothetical protein
MQSTCEVMRVPETSCLRGSLPSLDLGGVQ